MPSTDIAWPVWETRFEQFLAGRAQLADPVHDLAHVRRVVATAGRLAAAEGAEPAVVLPAAWLHDCVTVPKDAAGRSGASTLAAETAGAFLREQGYPARYLPAIEHAIAVHSFSAGIAPQTLEARVVQDADRLDALGAIGVARCLLLGGALGHALYEPRETFPVTRPPDDANYVLDHFYRKLLRLAGTMQTATARAEARARTAFMHRFLDQLASEVGVAREQAEQT